MGHDPDRADFCGQSSKFQSTCPRGARLAKALPSPPRACVSIHVPAWGTTATSPVMTAFNLVSIHVPAWGTTRQECRKSSGITVSIHVPAWGTTREVVPERSISCSFNPRARVGHDDMVSEGFDLPDIVSIHVPAWGTTTWGDRADRQAWFQSTCPRGARQRLYLLTCLS